VPGFFFVFNGQRLREIREDRGLSREALAVAASLSVATVASVELGYRGPSRAALLRLSAALGISPGELLERDPTFGAVAQ
jgi:transcriptional regulator with XRE-family HTH domain